MEIFNNLPTDFFETIDNICISLLLGILGIAITIFTVVYSFMENNKQIIRNLKDEIKNSEIIDPVKESDLLFANKYMSRMKSMNKVLIGIIIVDIFLFILFCVYLSLKSTTLRYYAYGTTLFLMLGCVITLYIYLSQYISRYKNL